MLPTTGFIKILAARRGSAAVPGASQVGALLLFFKLAVPAVKWILDYIIESYPVKAFTPGQASGDDIAVWNIKTDKDTRKCRIQGQFNNGKLTAYTVIYDHESPLV